MADLPVPPVVAADPTDALLTAIKDGNTAAAVLAIDAGANVTALFPSGDTVLWVAAYLGRTHIVARLMQAGLHPDLSCGPDLSTPLCAVAIAGHLDVARILLAAGARLDIGNKEQERPLALAAASGHPDLVRAFIAAGGDIDHAGNSMRTALEAAIFHEKWDCVKPLLNAGASVCRQPMRAYRWFDVQSAVVLAARRGAPDELFLELLRCVSKPSPKYYTCRCPADAGGEWGESQIAWELSTALRTAAACGQLGKVRALVDFIGVPVADLCYTSSPMTWVVPRSADNADAQLPIMAFLLGRGASPNAVYSMTGCSVLHTATLSGVVKSVELLLSYGANPLATDNKGYTPLMTLMHYHKGAIPDTAPEAKAIAELLRSAESKRLGAGAGAA